MLGGMARSQCQCTIRGAGFVQPQSRDRESWEHPGKDHHWCDPNLWLLSFCLTNLETSVVQEGAFELQRCAAKGQKAKGKTHNWPGIFTPYLDPFAPSCHHWSCCISPLVSLNPLWGMLVGCQAFIPLSLTLIFFSRICPSAVSPLHSEGGCWMACYLLYSSSYSWIQLESELRNCVGGWNSCSHIAAGGGLTAAERGGWVPARVRPWG